MAKTIPNSKQTTADIAAQHIAFVYAQALLDASEKSGDDEAVARELASLVDDVLSQYPALDTLLTSALISDDEKAGVLDRIFAERMTPLLLSFLKVVGKHERLGCLRTIRHETVKEYHRRHGKVAVELRVAVDLDDALTPDICDTLCRAHGVEPIMEKVVDPALIAGFTMTIGDKIYDGSTRTCFRRAREAIVEKTTHLIQAGHKG